MSLVSCATFFSRHLTVDRLQYLDLAVEVASAADTDRSSFRQVPTDDTGRSAIG
jgi:hypothetical protein